MGGKKWTEEELQLLKKLVNNASKKEILEAIPNRTWLAIQRIVREELRLNFNRYYRLKNSPRLDLSESDKRWLAASIDFEGYIGLVKARRVVPLGYNYIPTIKITNTDPKLINEFVRLTRTTSKIQVREDKEKNHKKQYTASTEKLRHIKKFLEEIKPFLISKNQQAKLILEFIDIQFELFKKNFKHQPYEYTKRQDEIYKKIKQLNKRGL